MNEIIKPLIREAGFSDDFINDRELCMAQNKFAELIIQECCRIVNLWTDEDLPEGREDVIQTVWIKKTFGIK